MLAPIRPRPIIPSCMASPPRRGRYATAVRPEIVVATRSVLADAFASRVLDEAVRAWEERGRFTLALTGGSSASVLYPRLRGLDVDWARTRLVWGDERAVPPGSEESNFHLAEEAWLG